MPYQKDSSISCSFYHDKQPVNRLKYIKDEILSGNPYLRMPYLD